MKLSVCGLVLAIFCAIFIAGCAPTFEQSSLALTPLVPAAGGAKEIFLSANGSQWDAPQESTYSRPPQKHAPPEFKPKRQTVTPPKITLVNVKNDSGRTIAKRVIPVYAGDILIASLKQELCVAGYTVKVVRELPKNVANGVHISRITAELEQNSGLFTVKGTCNLQVDLDIWRNGVKLKSHDYVSSVTDYSFSNQDKLFVDIINMSSQNIVKQAGPDMLVDPTVMHN